MSARDANSRTGLRYQPHEAPPAALSIGLGLQLVVLTVAVPILFPTVVMRAAGAPEAHVAWAVFAAVAISGVTTALQAARIGRIGGGHVLVMGSSSAFIGVCITAVAEGGPAMLATLVVISALFQLLLSQRLALFRRILTPAVAGTVIMLIPVTVMPFVFGLLEDVPEGSPALAAPLSALVTAVVICGISLKAAGAMRLWAPVIGVVAGSLVGGFFGLYDLDRVAAAPWIGLPQAAWPGFDLDFGPAFRALVPAFLLVAMIGTIRTISSSVAVQRASWRRRRALDFRAVQGAVNVEGIGNLVCGAAGTVPNTSYSVAASLTELTGVAARAMGVAAGIVFVALAFLPKALAAVLAIPGPVVTAYLTVLIAMLFLIGVKIVVQDGLDYRKGLVVGFAFWVGVGFQFDLIFPERVSEFAGGLFANGMTSGGLVAILMTLFMELAKPRRSRMEAELGVPSLPDIKEFTDAFASREGLTAAMADRLAAAAEETLLAVMQDDERERERGGRRLRLVAYREDGAAVLEFVVAPGEENLEDRIALIGGEADEAPEERDVSIRLLRHLASSVRHQQYHDIDIVTVRVKLPGPVRGG